MYRDVTEMGTETETENDGLCGQREGGGGNPRILSESELIWRQSAADETCVKANGVGAEISIGESSGALATSNATSYICHYRASRDDHVQIPCVHENFFRLRASRHSRTCRDPTSCSSPSLLQKRHESFPFVCAHNPRLFHAILENPSDHLGWFAMVNPSATVPRSFDVFKPAPSIQESIFVIKR